MDNETASTQQSTRLDSIQALRGVAALAVLFLHATSGFYFQGAWGVDLFFCISGFIMMYVTQNGSKFFLIKRAVRIIPLYWGLTLVKFAMAFAGKKLGIILPNAVSAENLIKSLCFWLPNDLPILGVSWTLNYEIHFYIIFALACLVSIKYRGAIAGLVMCACGLLLPGGIIQNNGICLEFAYGIAAFYIVQAARKRYSPTKIKTALSAASAFGFLALIYATGLAGFETGRQYYWGLPAFGLFLTTVIGLNHIKCKWLVKIGDMSYSIYLVHMFIVELIFGVSVLLGFGEKAAPDIPFEFYNHWWYLASVIITLTASIAISYISYTFVELKFTDFLKRKLINQIKS